MDYAHLTEKITHTENIRTNMTKWIANKDYRSIIQWVYNEKYEVEEMYSICLDIFNVKSKARLTKLFKTVLDNSIDIKTILLAKIMALFTNKKEKCIYVNVEPEDIIHYETIICDNNVLKNVYSCCGGIDQFNCLSLFKLTRTKYPQIDAVYRENWLYHASFAPVWSQRIRQFRGYVDYTKHKVVFTDDDLMEEFYQLYGLEPDEQPKEVRDKSIGKIVAKYCWKWFIEKYKGCNHLLDIYEEEIEDFDQDKLTY
jgi:hypothetical protein